MSTPALRGSVRVLLRQHRRSLWGAAALLLTGIGFVVALRIWIAARSSEELCADFDVTPCGDDTYMTTYARSATETFLASGGTAMLLLAGLAGAFVAGPLIAREFESGTFRQAWTQSVTPARWLAARLVVPMALVTAGTVVLILVYRWGRSSVMGSPYSWGLNWYDRGVYPALGPSAVGNALLAIAVGALCAVLLRRTLMAASVTLLVMGLVLVTMDRLRHSFWPLVRSTGTHHGGEHAWQLEAGMLTASGKELHWEDCFTSDPHQDPALCMRERGGVVDFFDYHPASHFWPLQLVETGILLLLAALAATLAFRVLRRRHA